MSSSRAAVFVRRVQVDQLVQACAEPAADGGRRQTCATVSDQAVTLGGRVERVSDVGLLERNRGATLAGSDQDRGVPALRSRSARSR
jgi:hypothetical protein